MGNDDHLMPRRQLLEFGADHLTGPPADSDIDLDAHDPPEFCEWKWVEPDLLPELIVPFKREVYAAIVEGFRALI